MPEDDFEQQHAKTLEAYHRREKYWQEREANLLRQLAEKDARIEILEKTSKFRTLTLDTIIKDSVISTKQDNTLRYVNAAYVTTTGYVEAEVIGRPITDFVRGLEFLTQFHEHPELIVAEESENLKKVPIVLLTKDGKEILMTADVGFSPGEVAGYNGVTILCTPKKWYARFGTPSTWFSRWHYVYAKECAEQGVLSLPDLPLESREISAAERFLQEITKEAMKTTNRGVAVYFEGVTSCSPKMYALFKSIDQVKECPLIFFVEENSDIPTRLREVGFPKGQLKILKKKKNKKRS